MSYVTENHSDSFPTDVVYLRGLGREVYSYINPIHPISNATLVEVTHDPVRYERRLQDGTVEVFALADRAASLPGRRIFLTEVIDPQGHTTEYTYDSNLRLVAVTDAIGQVTAFAYEHSTDPDLLTKVTDPFGRFALIGYDQIGRLNSITDAVGMTSTFTYSGNDFIASMTTPYGTTAFRHEPSTSNVTNFRWIEATDPAGGRERLEFHLQNSQLAATLPSEDVPTGFSASNAYLDLRNSFYWDKQAMASAPGDYSQAVITNWMIATDVDYGHATARAVPHSIKRPLESRVWYRYPGQLDSHFLGVAGKQPSLIGRIVDGGTSGQQARSQSSRPRDRGFCECNSELQINLRRQV